MSSIISQSLEKLSFGQPVHYLSMSMFPLIGDDDAGLSSEVPYMELAQALQKEQVSIEEVNQDGNVPELALLNHSDLDVLLVEGDHLVGAKQNRTLNTTIMAPAHEKIIIPVSCVESGRWSYRSSKFSYSDDFQFARGRRGKSDSVSESMKRSRQEFRVSRRSDQGEVWDAISRKQRILDSASATGAMDDIYYSRKDQLDNYLASFSPVKNMMGTIFMVGKEVAGIEYFGNAATMKSYLPRIVKSYAMDAVELDESKSIAPPVDDAASIVKQVTSAAVREYPSVGKGIDLRLDDSSIVGGGLAVTGCLVHLSVFRKHDSSQKIH